jgi:virulence factor Mce-like protein
VLPGNDVLLGGTRVGQVTDVKPVQRGGRLVAEFKMKLDRSLANLPAATTVTIRQRSNVGLKYVELTPRSDRGPRLEDGATIALRNAVESVSLDQSLEIYDAPTRRAIRGVLKNFGGGLAGRGGDINGFVEALAPALDDLAVVARRLRAPSTELRGFIDGLASAAATVSPVAGDLAAFFDAGATTFGAIARERDAFGETIDEIAASERVGTPALAAARPALTQAAALAREAGPGVAFLPESARAIATGLRVSGPAIGRSATLADPLRTTVGELRALARRPTVAGSLDRLTDTVVALQPTLTYFNPTQTVCNYLGLWFRNVPSVVSEGDTTATWFRFIPEIKIDEMLPTARPVPDFHFKPQPDAGQHGECENGNENYVQGQTIGAVPGVQPAATEPTPRGTLAEKIAAETAREGLPK